MTSALSQCHKCKHYSGSGECKAFPEIPNEILLNSHDHTKPFPGDNGIQFEPITEDDTDASINRNQGR